MRRPACLPNRERRGDFIAYLHRSRDEVDEARRQAREELAQLEADRQALQTEWIERQRSGSPSWRENFLELQKRFESEVARLAADIKDRATQAQIEKQTGRRMGQIVSEAREGADAAVVETLAASQQDLGVAIAATREAGGTGAACGRGAREHQRVQAAGDFPKTGWAHGTRWRRVCCG